MVLDEIFGAENFVVTCVWQRKQSPQNDAIYFSAMHDYVLVYAKQVKLNADDANGWQRRMIQRGQEQEDRYTILIDFDGRTVFAGIRHHRPMPCSRPMP
jgi:adenine-specific DNA-methyltransferase